MPTFKIVDTTQQGSEPEFESAPTMEDAALNFILRCGLSIEEIKEDANVSTNTGTTEVKG